MKSIGLLGINWEVSLRKRKLSSCLLARLSLTDCDPFRVFFAIGTCNKTDFYFRIITKKNDVKKNPLSKIQLSSVFLSTIMLKPFKNFDKSIHVILVYCNDNSFKNLQCRTILNWRSESVFISEMAISKKFLCVYICYTDVLSRRVLIYILKLNFDAYLIQHLDK